MQCFKPAVKKQKEKKVCVCGCVCVCVCVCWGGGVVLAARQTGGIITSASDIGENFIFHLTIYNSAVKAVVHLNLNLTLLIKREFEK